MNVGAFAGESRYLRLAEAFAICQKLLECRSMLPVQLIDGPRGDRRFGQCLHPAGDIVLPRFLELRRQGVTRGHELGRRQLEEGVDVVFFSLSHVT